MPKNTFFSSILILCTVLYSTSGQSANVLKIFNPTYFSTFEKDNLETFIQNKDSDLLKMALSVDSGQTLENYK